MYQRHSHFFCLEATSSLWSWNSSFLSFGRFRFTLFDGGGGGAWYGLSQFFWNRRSLSSWNSFADCLAGVVVHQSGPRRSPIEISVGVDDQQRSRRRRRLQHYHLAKNMLFLLRDPQGRRDRPETGVPLLVEVVRKQNVSLRWAFPRMPWNAWTRWPMSDFEPTLRMALYSVPFAPRDFPKTTSWHLYHAVTCITPSVSVSGSKP